MMEKMKMHSQNQTQKNIAQIQKLFPNCVTECCSKNGNMKFLVDFDQLRQELSDSIVEGSQERYHLDWPGKRQALLNANSPTAKTLRPQKSESVDFNETKNLFIEGDNLEALKLLQETYLGKIKVIYIDPPYNTGNDFIYRDSFAESANEYLKDSKQIDQERNRLVANTESNGRFHSDWLSMMYPRLKLARNLLRDDGVIFVSIGVEELSNLKLIMDQVFGEFNFIELFSWVKTSTPPALSAKSRKTNEYILCYEKSRNQIKYRGGSQDGGDQPLLNRGNKIRKLLFPKNKVRFSFIENGEIKSGKKDRVELVDDLEIVNSFANKDFGLIGEFKWTQETLDKEIDKGTIFVIKSDIFSIRFLKSTKGQKPPTNFIKEKYMSPIIDKQSCNVGTNESASSELRKLMSSDVFSYPKPVSLIEYLLNFVVEENDIVMDFFAGSGTTAEAVFNCSAKNNIALSFILIQLPENLESALLNSNGANSGATIQNGINLLKKQNKPLFLSELTKLRIATASKTYSNSPSKTQFQDVGFRVLKIDSSNMEDVHYAADAIDQSDLIRFRSNIKLDRTPEDLLFQVLLDWGVDLMLSIEQKQIQSKTVFFVNSTTYELIACFDNGVNEDLVKELAHFEPQRVVFRDTGFESDDIKINVDQIFRQMSPSTEVKSI